MGAKYFKVLTYTPFTVQFMSEDHRSITVETYDVVLTNAEILAEMPFVTFESKENLHHRDEALGRRFDDAFGMIPEGEEDFFEGF